MLCLKLEAQYYKEHHIAPAPWLYWHDANEIILATPIDSNIYIELRKSDGSFLTTLTAKKGSPAVYRPSGKFSDHNRYPLNTIIKDAGIILRSDQIFSVNVRNIASDQLGTDAYIKGNASLTSLGNPGIGLSFRVGYYRDGPLPELPIYSIMALYDQTNVSINGISTIILDKGESYLFTSPIGSLAETTKPCVMNSSAFLDAPGGCGDGAFDQIPPVNSLGNLYFIVRTQGNSISEQSTVVATEDTTNLTINRYNATGGFLSTSNIVLRNAGNFLTISNGDGTTPFSVAEIIADKKLAVFMGSAQSCEVDVSTCFPVSSPCNGSNFIETSSFKAYRNNDLPYFCYILLQDANAKVQFNGTDIESIVSKRKQIGNTNWYMINLNSNQVGNPSTISISSAIKLYVAIIQIGGGFSMSATFSNLIEQPPVPNVLYIQHGLCPTHSALLTAGTMGSDYQWYFNGKAINGANDSFYVATKAGLYYIRGLLPCGEYQESAPVSVTFDSIPSGRQSVESCSSYIWLDSIYSESGIFSRLITNTNGCDSIATLELLIHKSSQSVSYETACEQFKWSVNLQTYFNSGIYTDTLVNSIGCDSVITLNLVINKPIFQTNKVNVCKSYIWPANGIRYNQSGVYIDTLINYQGCDSILELELNILQPTVHNISVQKCKEYYWPVNATTYNQSGIYSDTILNANGCDSILHLDLQILKASLRNISIRACKEYFWPENATSYNQSGIYTDTILNANGCDSITVLNLEILHENKIEDSVSICSSYRWPVNNHLYDKSGSYIELFKNEDGCDSVRILHLNILGVSRDTQRIGTCQSYYWSANGKNYSKTGIYSDTLVNHWGCDSIAMLDLMIYKDYHIVDTQRQCGEYYWPAADKILKSSGNYQFNLQTQQGCDSVITLDLTIDPKFINSDTISAFQKYYWPVTKTLYEQGGIYDTIFRTTYGCDSLHVLVLKIRQPGNVFIPNVFTPNDDGVNDRFIVFATPEIVKIDRLRIYDRWGQLVFEELNFPPNEFAYGWDGMIKAQKSSPAVFVCTVEWKDTEGRNHILSVDVTLIR